MFAKQSKETHTVSNEELAEDQTHKTINSDELPGKPFGRYIEKASELGELVESKQKQYGDSAGKSEYIMRILYPGGIAPYQMRDALLIVRVIDKLSRISQRQEDGKDLGGESPWKDISGYGLLGCDRDERNSASEY